MMNKYEPVDVQQCVLDVIECSTCADSQLNVQHSVVDDVSRDHLQTPGSLIGVQDPEGCFSVCISSENSVKPCCPGGVLVGEVRD
jgi:hypothetical protein